MNPPPPPSAMNGTINMTINSSDNPSVFGELVTFTAYVVAPFPYTNVPVTGKVCAPELQ